MRVSITHLDHLVHSPIGVHSLLSIVDSTSRIEVNWGRGFMQRGFDQSVKTNFKLLIGPTSTEPT